jgi:hypothetical protein
MEDESIEARIDAITSGCVSECESIEVTGGVGSGKSASLSLWSDEHAPFVLDIQGAVFAQTCRDDRAESAPEEDK